MLRGFCIHVKRLADLAGVSVRTLHHYDRIGLLVPSAHTPAGYRLYGTDDLLRLHQILFYRELGLALSEISGILDRPDFDPVRALEQHRALQAQQAERIGRLLETYEGFPGEQIERYRREAREMYDPALVAESERRTRRMTEEEWENDEFRAFYDRIAAGLAGFLSAAMERYAARVLGK